MAKLRRLGKWAPGFRLAAEHLMHRSFKEPGTEHLPGRVRAMYRSYRLAWCSGFRV